MGNYFLAIINIQLYQSVKIQKAKLQNFCRRNVHVVIPGACTTGDIWIKS